MYFVKDGGQIMFLVKIMKHSKLSYFIKIFSFEFIGRKNSQKNVLITFEGIWG